MKRKQMEKREIINENERVSESVVVRRWNDGVNWNFRRNRGRNLWKDTGEGETSVVFIEEEEAE